MSPAPEDSTSSSFANQSMPFEDLSDRARRRRATHSVIPFQQHPDLFRAPGWMRSFQFHDQTLDVAGRFLRRVPGSTALILEGFRSSSLVAADPFVGGFLAHSESGGEFGHGKFSAQGKGGEFQPLVHRGRGDPGHPPSFRNPSPRSNCYLCRRFIPRMTG